MRDVNQGALTQSDPVSYFDACLRQANVGLGQATVAVLGRVGAGKSTLVNGVFGAELAAAGVGAPLTERIVEYRMPGTPLTLLDTPGLELGGTGAEDAADAIAGVIEQRAALGVSNALHVVWYCVNAEEARLEEAEEILLRRCAEAVPTIVVLTKVFAPDDTSSTALRGHIDRLDLPIEATVPVLAKRRVVGGRDFGEHGLLELVSVTTAVLPDAARRAFVVTQRRALDAKATEAREIVRRRSLEIGALSVVREGVDPAFLSRQHLRMLADISTLFSIDVPSEQLQVIIRVVTQGAGGVERVVGRVLDLLERAGMPATGVVSATVGAATAGASIRILGEAFTRLCLLIARRDLEGQSIGERQIIDLIREVMQEDVS